MPSGASRQPKILVVIAQGVVNFNHRSHLHEPNGSDLGNANLLIGVRLVTNARQSGDWRSRINFPHPRDRRHPILRGGNAGRCGRGLERGRPGFCYHSRGAGLRGWFRLPIARV